MTARKLSSDIFFKGSDLDLKSTTALVQAGLKDADYGEFYHEISEAELLVKDKGAYTNVSVGNSEAGFGFRVGQKEKVGYSFSDIFNAASLKAAISEARQVLDGDTSSTKQVFGQTPQQLYPLQNPMQALDLAEKIRKIDEIEAFARALDPAIANVTVTYSGAYKAVHIITADGQSLVDSRPVAGLSISIQLTGDDGKTETGHAMTGGRVDCTEVFDPAVYEAAARKALHMGKELMRAVDAPAGVMDVVLSPGWSAVLLHEAVGHGLEGDFNRRSISVYSGKVGQQVASPEVTVIDQGDMPGERGSVHFDDEGTPGRRNVLIENGILKGYMQDRQNAQLMGEEPTGNGRRQSYAHVPMPRMTNTYFENGKHDPADIVKSVKDGLFITDMGGGQVDITSGKFNMNATLGYRIRNGQICEPVKGATLVGNGLDVIQSISMVGNDLKIEKSSGMCGKNDQSVMVGCGQPTVKVSNMTVGGTKK